ncbi:uncharacterized protein N7483_007607, partial [Penicillium malachiteum]|uniref:uncharacterized protein n=1 Tax=Penicillium malachiteum TaxID=1324776 RepID=UPI002546F365
TAGVLIINLVFVGLAARISRRYTNGFLPTALVYRGICTLFNRWETALSLVVNILSEVVLCASNYAMQTLVAPTRDELNWSHSQHKWLDIGSTSFRNLFAIPKSRLALWFVLIITATSFHLLLLSIVFKSIPTNFYDVILGPSDLHPHDIQSISTPNLQNCLGRYPYDFPWSAEYRWDDFVSDLESDNFKTLSNDECKEYTDQNTQAGVKFMMMLTNETSVQEGAINLYSLAQLLKVEHGQDNTTFKVVKYRHDPLHMCLHRHTYTSMILG